LDEYKQIQPSQIDVRDINPDVQDQITPYGVNFSHRDSLLHNPLTDGSRTTGIYSHIIGNPPYLNKQSDYIKQNKKLLKPIYDEIGVHDTYAMFIYLCCQLLQAGGVL
jgi:tRNA1(Val) A37 N6-methylase TrmN6